MGDGADIPWRLLDIEVLVEDPETGGWWILHAFDWLTFLLFIQ